jgi:hypothetical protein
MNELWAVLAGVMLSTLPATSAPNIAVDYSAIESAVQHKIESKEDVHASVSCGGGTLLIPSDTTRIVTCSVKVAETSSRFEANVKLHAKESGVDIQAVVIPDNPGMVY